MLSRQWNSNEEGEIIKQLGESEEIKDYQAKIQLWKA